MQVDDLFAPVGLLLIAGTFFVGVRASFKPGRKPNNTTPSGYFLMLSFATGIVLIFARRTTEINFWSAKITTAASKAESEAEKIKDLRKDLEQQLQRLRSDMTNAQDLLELNTIILGSVTDDRNSFVRLKGWATVDYAPYKLEAMGAYIATVNRLPMQQALFDKVIVPTPLLNPNLTGLDLLINYRSQYEEAFTNIDATSRNVIIRTVGNDERLSENQRREFLTNVFVNDRSLQCTYKAGEILTKRLNLSVNFVSLPFIRDSTNALPRFVGNSAWIGFSGK